jgi:predicted permease
LGFALAASVAATLAIGLLTAMRRGDMDLRAVLADTARTGSAGRRRERMRQALVVTQVALTLVLLSGTALLARSFAALLAIEPGYRTAGATIVDVVRPRGSGAEESQRQWQFQEALIERLRGLPGIESVGLASSVPLGAAFYPNGQYLEMTRVDEVTSPADLARLGDRVKERAGQAGFRVVSGGYFDAMRIPILAGRTFGAGDLPDAPHVAVVSRSFAEARWPGRDPLGRFIQFGNMDGDVRGFRIVGVAGDVRELSPETPPGPLFYVDYRQRPGQASRFSVVVTGPMAEAQAPALQQAVRDLDPTLPVTIRTVEQALDVAMSGRRFNLLLITAFGAGALALATFGTYGLITYLVTQRTREIGIRLALGATARGIVRLVVGAGLRLAVAGTILGLGVTLWLSRLVEGLLFSVSRTDPAALAVVVAATVGAVAVASFVPAMRAARVSPTTSLR